MKVFPRRSQQSGVDKVLYDSQNEATSIESHLKSPTLMMLVLIAVVGAILYASFLFNPDNRGDLLPYVLVILAETFLLGQALLALWTVLASSYEPRTFQFHSAQDRLFVKQKKLTANTELMQGLQNLRGPIQLHGELISVDVFVTTYGEDVNIIKNTVTAAKKLLGSHTTYILDDGKSDIVRQLAKTLQVNYIRRPSHDGAKAGNINYALKRTDGEFFAVFDADFVPSKEFLYETLPFFEDVKTAFVQTPQHYDNLDGTISRGAGYMQHLFYALIQPGKNRFNAAFCVGTNVVFRRSAVIAIGGMYAKSKSEDIWTSLKLHEAGYKSVYIPTVLAVGKTPDNIKAYSKQQLRWATGGFEIMFQCNPLFNRKLTVDQRLQYFGTATYYLSGLASLFLLLLPPLQIFLNLTPVNLHIPVLTWALYYSGFYVMQILVAFYTMGGFRLQTLLLANASFPIYTKALFNALFKRDQSWNATGSITKVDSAFNYIIPQFLFFVFLLGTTAVGVWKANYTGELSLSIFWNMINTIVLGTFVYIAVRETRRLKRALKSTKHISKKAERVVTA